MNKIEYDPMVENRLKDLYFKAQQLAQENPETHVKIIENQLSILLDNYQTRERSY